MNFETDCDARRRTMHPDKHREELHIDDSIAMNEATDQNTQGEAGSNDKGQVGEVSNREPGRRSTKGASSKAKSMAPALNQIDAGGGGIFENGSKARDTLREASETNKSPRRSVPKAAPVEIERLSAAQKRGVHERELSILLRQQGRAFSQALMTIAGTRQRSGRLWLICGATLIVITLLIIQVYYKHRDLNLGYNLSEAISMRESLLEENRKLRIELRVLSRRERLEPYATQQLGMTTIRPDQIVIVHEAKRDDKEGHRLDGLDNVRRIEER